MLKVDVDLGRDGESKGLADHLEVQLLYVKDMLVRVGGVGEDVSAECVARRPVQMVVLTNEVIELRLHVRHLAGEEEDGNGYEKRSK